MGIFRKIAERIRGFKIKDGVLIKYKGKKKNVVIPDSVTSIGNHAFYKCSSLTSITIPENVTSIGEGVFEGCSSLENITVEQGNPIYHSEGNCIIETASKTLIAGCKNSVIPADGSVTSIGDRAFFSCNLLTSITIPDSVTSIGDSAFWECKSLKSIVIPDGVTSIGDSAFDGCRSLTSIVIGSGVTSIGERAFYDCGSLKSIVIPDSVTSIGNSAFFGCRSLTNVTIPDSVTSIGDKAFSGCSSLKTIEYTGTEEQWEAVKKDWNWNPEYAKVICTGAYYGNSKSI